MESLTQKEFSESTRIEHRAGPWKHCGPLYILVTCIATLLWIGGGLYEVRINVKHTDRHQAYLSSWGIGWAEMTLDGGVLGCFYIVVAIVFHLDENDPLGRFINQMDLFNPVFQ